MDKKRKSIAELVVAAFNAGKAKSAEAEGVGALVSSSNVAGKGQVVAADGGGGAAPEEEQEGKPSDSDTGKDSGDCADCPAGGEECDSKYGAVAEWMSHVEELLEKLQKENESLKKTVGQQARDLKALGGAPGATSVEKVTAESPLDDRGDFGKLVQFCNDHAGSTAVCVSAIREYLGE